MEAHKEELESQVAEVWKLLSEKGLKMPERMKVRSAFVRWGQEFDANVEFDHKHKTYSNKLLKGYHFETEREAKFAGDLVKFLPEAKPEKLMQTMSIILKLFDVKSEWTWKA